MKTAWRTSLSALLVVAALTLPAGAADTAAPPQGYVLLKGEDARRALGGTLLRIWVRDVVRKDGSKAAVYRDVDYPVRTMPAPESKPAAPDKPTGESDDDEPDSAEEKKEKPIEVAVYVFFGPEYEDPPPPGTSPSPNRLRRAGPASVKYEWDDLKEGTGGDEVLRLEFDFSGAYVVIKSGYWQMEAEAGEIEKDTKPGFDFLLSQGAYGSSDGHILTRDLHRGPPDVIEVDLVSSEKDRPAKTYRLKKQPVAD